MYYLQQMGRLHRYFYGNEICFGKPVQPIKEWFQVPSDPCQHRHGGCLQVNKDHLSTGTWINRLIVLL